MKVGPFTFTRDSAVWLWSTIAAIIVGLATVDETFAVATLGIPLAWLTKIRLAAFVIGLGSAKVSNSFLPGKKDAASVNLSKLAPVLLLVLLGGAALSLPACSSTHQAPVLTPAQQAAAILQRVDELQNAVISARTS
jgi:hypothetical protein